MSAEQLVKEYAIDPSAFEKKYRDTTLLITGEVTAVKIGIQGQQFMELKGDEKWKVECYRDSLSGWKWPERWKEGAKVRFIGSSTLAQLEGAVRVLIDTPLDID